MGRIRPFVKKETLHIIRDKRTVLMVVLMPITLLIIFGFAISTEVRNVNAGAVIAKHSAAARAAISRLEGNPYITFTGALPYSEAENSLLSSENDAVVIFPEDFAQTLDYQILTDASNPTLGPVAAQYIENAIGGEPDNMPLTHLLFNPRMKSAYNFVPGIMGLIFLLICILMTSISIVREKETGTMQVLLISPARASDIVFAKMIPYFYLSLIDLALVILISTTLLEVPLSGNLLWVALISAVYIILALAIGLFISTISSKQVIALIISAVLTMMPVMLLSGMLFPVENMPGALRLVSKVIPATWYIEAMRKLMIQGAPIGAVWKEAAILCGMAVFVIIVALRGVKERTS